jgi:hypothetical protein
MEIERERERESERERKREIKRERERKREGGSAREGVEGAGSGLLYSCFGFLV